MEGVNLEDENLWSVYQRALDWKGESGGISVPETWKSEQSIKWEIPEDMSEELWIATVLDADSVLGSKRYQELAQVVSYVYDCAEYNRIFISPGKWK